MEVYNGGVLLGNSPRATSRDITILGLNAEIKDDVEKAQISARGKYLANAFLLSSDRRRYRYLILLLKNDYQKKTEELPKDPHRHVQANGGV